MIKDIIMGSFCYVVLFVLTIVTSNFAVANQTCTVHNATYWDCRNAGLTKFPIDLPKTLEYLDVSENVITVLPVLQNLPALRLLIAKKNKISKVNRGAFKNLNKLTDLDLSHNNLTGELLTVDFFIGCDSVRMVNLSHNPLKILNEDAFEETELGNLAVIDISFCELTKIDEFAMIGVGLFKLQELHMRGNYINENTARQAFDYLDHVKLLDVGENSFTHLDGAFFRDLTNLEELRLDGNNITRLSNLSFFKLSFLRALNLANNKLNVFPTNALQYFENLEELDMTGNPISIVGTAGYNLHIKTLFLDHLPYLQKLGKHAFVGIPGLKSLSISECASLTDVHEGALNGVNLVNLSLRGNYLVNLPPGLVEWHKLDHLYLDSNPWRCDCKLEWLLHLSRDWNLNLTCRFPSNMRGTSLLEIHPGTLSCLSYNVKTILISLSIVACLVVVTMAMLLIRRRVKKVHGWRNFCHCCLRNRTDTSNGMYATVQVYDNDISESTVNIINKNRSNSDRELSDDEDNEDNSAGKLVVPEARV